MTEMIGTAEALCAVTRVRKTRRLYTKEQRARWNGRVLERARAARAEYRAGTYVQGTWHREATCEGCKRLFPKWRIGEQMRFCSRQCAGIDFAGIAQAEIDLRCKARRQERLARNRVSPTERTCAYCSSKFVALGQKKLCSAACRRATARRRFARKPPLVAQRNCLRCKKPFTGRAGGGRGNKGQIFCSERCNDAYHDAGGNHRQRARHYGVAYEPIKTIVVLARDGWQCQICGETTPQSLRGTTEARAPELDHRVPLARGGSHTWGNVQCACRACNLAKGSSYPSVAQHRESACVSH